MSTHVSARRPARLPRLLTGAAVGGALVLAAPLAASAHVHVSPEESGTGATTRLGFSFSHACDDSPTTALVFTIPDGVDGVTPVADGAWTISRELGTDGIPTEVTYTAVQPIESGIAATVSLDVIFAPTAAHTAVAFPVRQECVVGATDWSEVAADGESADALDSPAPVVQVGAAAASAGHDHGAAAEPGDDHDGHDGAAEAEAEGSTADPVARWLGGGALVAALAAIGVAFGVRRRRP